MWGKKKRGKGVYMVVEGDLTWDIKRTIQYRDDVELYTWNLYNFLTNVNSKNSIEKMNRHRDSTSGELFEETQNTNSKEYMHLYVLCSIIYNSQDMEATQVPIIRQLTERAVVHIYSGILLSL